MYSITTIIPAYNEEKRIGQVLESLKEVDLIENIIVVSDGSRDNTVKIARSHGVYVIELPHNIGKGGAIIEGLKRSDGDIILLLDADLVGLKPKHITSLLVPIIDNRCDMTIGVFNNGRFITDLAQILTPYLSGQRAIKSHILKSIMNLDNSRYGLELAITEYGAKNNIKVKEVILENLTHVMKEEKMGFYNGFKERLKMYFDIARYISLNKILTFRR